jgi:hypothetical protein
MAPAAPAWRYPDFGPRLIAATPVRHSSTNPSGAMMAMNSSTLGELPVTWKTKWLAVA